MRRKGGGEDVNEPRAAAEMERRTSGATYCIGEPRKDRCSSRGKLPSMPSASTVSAGLPPSSRDVAVGLATVGMDGRLRALQSTTVGSVQSQRPCAAWQATPRRARSSIQ